MAKKNVPQPTSEPSGLTHNPFAKLASHAPLAALPLATLPPAPAAAPPPKPAPPVTARKLRFRLETKGRSGKVVTRVLGLPGENLEAIAARLRKALGCGAVVEEGDVLLLGALVERATQWLEGAGDLRAIADERPDRPPVAEPGRAPARASGPTGSAPEAAPASPDGRADPDPQAGTRRSNVRRGQRVAIVLKADQPTGKLTEGIVRELLTSSPTHPRGIKVRLESGEVGRVKIVYLGP